MLRELVERAIRVKAEVVAADLRETGGADGHPGREALNYGHTLGARDRAHRGLRDPARRGRRDRLVFVAEVAGRAGLLAPTSSTRHHTAFARVGLPTTYDGAPFETLHAAMRVDKKSRGDLLRFVVLTDVARPGVLAGPDEADLRAAYVAIGGHA